MRICTVCHPSQGGSGIFASELGAALARRGHDIHFVTHTMPFRLTGREPNITFHKVEVSDYPLFRFPPYSIALAGALARLCREINFDVLHVHYAIPHAISAYLSQSILQGDGPPIVTTLHGTDVTVVGTEHELNEVTAFVLNSSSRVTAVSNFLREAARVVYNIDREIDVLPNFVDTDRFHPGLRNDQRQHEFAPDGEKLIGHMSNYREVKRVGDVLETFYRVHKVSDARLVLIGDGVGLQDARSWLEGNGLLEKTTILGAQKHVENILPQLDLFMLPSRTESFGLAALEAMASGVPILASTAGGLPEVIRHNVDGMLVPVGDIEALTEGALSILEDDARRMGMGRAARERAVSKFHTDGVVDRYEALYREMAQN